MTTSWTSPTIISQYADEGTETVHISWKHISKDIPQMSNGPAFPIALDGYLDHIARSPKYDIMNKTYFIRTAGYNFVNIPTVINGIEVRINARRYGRITDETIQLCLNNILIGESRANLQVDPTKVYGSSTDLWSTTISNIDISDPTFGLIIRFQSHPHWPHRDTAFLESIEMRIH